MALGVLVAFAALLSGVGSASAALPDGRGWEQVSPAEKDGASVDPLGKGGGGGPSGGLVAAAEGGGAITYTANGPVTSEPQGNRAIEGSQVFSQRTPQGWTSRDIVPPYRNAEGFEAGPPQEYRDFSPDLSAGLLEPFGLTAFREPPLVPGVSSEERGLYLRNNLTCEASPATCYEPLVTDANVTATSEGEKAHFGGRLNFLGASADLRHVVFESAVQLTESAAPGGGLYEWNSAQPAGEQLQLVSVMPNKSTPATNPFLGNNFFEFKRGVRNAVSSDGSRVFFNALVSETTEATGLFMRDTQAQRTIRVNIMQGTSGSHAEPHFQTASADGSRVFFTDGRREKAHDLWVCETGPTIEPTTKTCPKLTDLTGPELGFTGPGDVVGVALGASEDGSSVYFVANGAEAGGTTGTCPDPTAEGVEPSPSQSCNLYEARFGEKGWEVPKLIAVLSAEDAPDWAGAGDFLTKMSSAVSPDGRYLAFMSERPLTQYDNRDANPAAHEARDEEVFLYDSLAEKLRCASCNPNPAQPPTGVFDPEPNLPGAGLVIDPNSTTWPGRWLAASLPHANAMSPFEAPLQTRYLLNDGRLYFNSADALVAQDTNSTSEAIPGTSEPAKVGVADVYQFEPEGTGSCTTGAGGCVSLLSSGTAESESAFLEASAGGDDAFFLTAQSLVSADKDTVFDVYDAHVCSEGSPCITPPPPPATPCSDEASCRSGNGSGSPTFGAPTSETPLGVSNAGKLQTLPSKTTVAPKAKPLTRAQKLKRALSACRKAHKRSKRKRVSCERSARHKYASKKAAKK
jgi:hypothetical protein